MTSSPSAGAITWNPIGRPPSSSPIGSEIPGSPARLLGMVQTSEKYMVSGSSVFSRFERRSSDWSATRAHRPVVGRSEVAADQGADLLRLTVEGVVVAGAQRIGAEQDPPGDLGPKSGRSAPGHHLLRGVSVDPQAVADTVEAGEVGRALGRRNEVVGREGVLERRERDLHDLSARIGQRVDRHRPGRGADVRSRCRRRSAP